MHHDHAAVAFAHGQPIAINAQQRAAGEGLAVASRHDDLFADVPSERAVGVAARQHDAPSQDFHAGIAGETQHDGFGIHRRRQAADAQGLAAALQVDLAGFMHHAITAVHAARGIAGEQRIVTGVIDRQRGIADAG